MTSLPVAPMPGRKASEEERRDAILRAAFVVAAREGLTGITARGVAAEARVSSGLVFFYFESVDGLLVSLLDWLLERTIVAGEVAAVTTGDGDAASRMMATIRRDIERLPRQRARVELFFDFWVLGTHHPVVRRMIRKALDRYRAAFRPLATAMVREDPERYRGVTAEGLAEVAASFVEGCALQVVMDPAHFDAERSMSTLGALVRQPAALPR